MQSQPLLEGLSFAILGENISIDKIFSSQGAERVTVLKDADIIVFQGGHDVSPEMYGQTKHALTSSKPERDIYEAAVYRKFPNAFKVGICRGAQFLHVMNGGSLFQNVDGHGRVHKAYYLEADGPKEVFVTSTHHQMMSTARMKVSQKPQMWMWATEATRRESCHHGVNAVEFPKNTDGALDPELLWYLNTKSFCFQPHPEYLHAACRTVFWSMLRRALLFTDLLKKESVVQ